jgi:hypothetical protein
MKLGEALKKIFSDNGIEIDPEEFDQLGLTDQDDELTHETVDLSEPLPGKAAGELEVFLAADSTKIEATEKDGLIWAPIARAGQWALRPDGKGGKKRIPLKIISGHSKDQRREIGLQDVVDAFEDNAIEDVTVPESHDNKPTENHGYIEKLKLAKGKLRDGTTADVLMGGYSIPDKKTRKKFLDGLVPNRSAGFLYDYERTDTGKKYPVALEHVALTSKAWLRGMPRFGRPVEALSESEEFLTVPLTLSDDGPSEDEYIVVLADPAPDDDFLAEPTISWPQEDSPEWLKQRVNDILDEARRTKQKNRMSSTSYLVEEDIPRYRCIEAKPGLCLITDGWGDRANSWVASITVKDGEVKLSDSDKWKATKQVYIPDEQREMPTGEKAPLSDDDKEIETPRGGGNMADDVKTLQLSEEAKAQIKAAEDRAASAEKKSLELAEKVDRLLGTRAVNEADKFIVELKSMGLDEAHGFGGMLLEIHALALADDGGPAVQSDHFADDKNTTGELSVTDALRRVFGALKKADDGKVALGEIVKPPSESTSENGPGEQGKPGKEEEEEDISTLSDDEILKRHEKKHPGVLAAAGIKLSDSSTNSNGKSE